VDVDVEEEAITSSIYLIVSPLQERMDVVLVKMEWEEGWGCKNIVFLYMYGYEKEERKGTGRLAQCR